MVIYRGRWAVLGLVVAAIGSARAEPIAPVVCGAAGQCTAVVPSDATRVTLDLGDVSVRGLRGARVISAGHAAVVVKLCQTHWCATVNVAEAWTLHTGHAKISIHSRPLRVGSASKMVGGQRIADMGVTTGLPVTSVSSIGATSPPAGKELLGATNLALDKSTSALIGGNEIPGAASTPPPPAPPPPPPAAPRPESSVLVPNPVSAPHSDHPLHPRPAPDDHSFADIVLIGAGALGCTGIVIEPRLVLTAAHCLPATRVVFATSADAPSTSIAVTASHAHPGGLDAAVLELANASPWPPRPVREAGTNAPPRGALKLIGFGLDEPRLGAGFGIKRGTDVFVDGWGCDRERPRDTGCDPRTDLVIPATSGRDTCNGDSGGPVLEWTGTTWRLVAVTSRPTMVDTAACGRGGIYTRVDVLAGWLAAFRKGAR